MSYKIRRRENGVETPVREVRSSVLAASTLTGHFPGVPTSHLRERIEALGPGQSVEFTLDDGPTYIVEPDFTIF